MDERAVNLRALFEEEYPRLVRLAAVFLRDRDAAEEVVQDAFVALHQHWNRIADPSARAAYLRSAVCNRSRDRLRRARTARRKLPALVATGAGDETALSDERRAVLDALASLPRRQREVLALRYYLDLPESEIAATLGISTGAVKSTAHRGLTRLGAHLEASR